MLRGFEASVLFFLFIRVSILTNFILELEKRHLRAKRERVLVSYKPV